MGRINVDADTWLIMREHPSNPKAIVERVTDTAGVARFMVKVWHPNPLERRMAGIYETLGEADEAVPWEEKSSIPPGPYLTKREREAQKNSKRA